jgi:hypothetical protein
MLERDDDSRKRHPALAAGTASEGAGAATDSAEAGDPAAINNFRFGDVAPRLMRNQSGGH